MFFSVYNTSMQQRKLKRPQREFKPSIRMSHIGYSINLLSPNKSQDNKSKLHTSQDSLIKQFNKPKIHLNSLGSIGNQEIQDQIKKEIAQVNDLLKDCQIQLSQRKGLHSEKQQLLDLQEVIKWKDQTIKNLGVQIQHLKKNEKANIDEYSHSSTHRATTECSDKEPKFKLAQEIKNQREQLSKYLTEHTQKYNNYLKIKKMIEQIETKYTHKQNEKKSKENTYHEPPLMTYKQFKEKAKTKKDEPFTKSKKFDFYRHLSPEQQTNPIKNMKDLLTRKMITLTALKNSRKKHEFEMPQLIAKLEFLKDEDVHLAEKIKEKQEELVSMERKFNHGRVEKAEFKRHPLLHYHL